MEKLTKQQKLKRDMMALKYQGCPNEGLSMAFHLDELISHLNDDGDDIIGQGLNCMGKDKVVPENV